MTNSRDPSHPSSRDRSPPSRWLAFRKETPRRTVLVAAVIWTFVAPVIIDAVGPIVHPTWRDAVVGLTLLASFAAAAYWVLAYFVYGLIDQSTIAGQDPHSRTASAAPSATATPRRARWSVVLVGAALWAVTFFLTTTTPPYHFPDLAALLGVPDAVVGYGILLIVIVVFEWVSRSADRRKDSM
jgi:hypothetical protein